MSSIRRSSLISITLGLLSVMGATFRLLPEEAAPLCLLAINRRRRPGSCAMAPRCRLGSYAMTPRAYHRWCDALAVHPASTLEPNLDADSGQSGNLSVHQAECSYPP